jgi:hypothetical protein
MSDVTYCPTGSTVLLILGLVDNETPANNPVTGYTCVVAIRKVSNDTWYDFGVNAWDVVSGGYGSLASANWGALTDKGDGSYSRTWNQETADAGATEKYVMHYKVQSAGAFQNRVSIEDWVFSPVQVSEGAMITLTVHGPDGVVAGAKVSLGATGGATNVMFSAEDGTVRFERADGSYAYTVECEEYTSAQGVVTVSGGVVTSPAGGVLTVTALPTPGQVPVIGRTGSGPAFGVGIIVGSLPDGYCWVFVDFQQVAGSTVIGAGDATIQIDKIIGRPSESTVVLGNTDDPTECDAEGVARLAVLQGATVSVQAKWPTKNERTVVVTIPDDETTYDLGQDLQ